MTDYDSPWKECLTYFLSFSLNKEKNMPFITTPERYGRMEGLAKGRIQAIEAVLTVRFPDTAEDVLPEIRQILDADQLKKILDAAKTVASPQELRKLWAK